MGKLIRGTSNNARFVALDSKDILQEIVVTQKIEDNITKDLISKILGFTIMLSTTLKDFKLLTVRVDSEAYLKSIVVSMDSTSHVKAYVSFNEEFKDTTVATLRVIIDKGLKEPYSSVTNIDFKTLMDDISLYFYKSEQIPTLISAGASFDTNNEIKNSGALMLQILPSASDEFINKMQEKALAIRPVNELLDGGMTLIDMINLLYDDMSTEDNTLIEEYKILSEEEVSFYCNCNKEKFKSALMTIGHKEIEKILEEDGKIETVCHFCNKNYIFKKDDFNLN